MQNPSIQLGYVAVELSEREAELFALFMQHHRNIEFLLDNGVFDVKRGVVTLNFSKYGEITWVGKKMFQALPKY